RAHGTFQQPNPYGGYLGLLVPLAYGIVLAEGRTAWAAIRTGRPARAWLWGLAVISGGVMLAGLVMSWSRGALLGLAAGAGLVFLSLGRKAWAVAAALALMLAFLGPGSVEALPGDLVGRVTETFEYINLPDLTAVEIDDANFSVIERAAHWLAAWRMFSRAPWLGVGTGQYATVYPQVALPRWQDPLGHAHNYYLNVLAEGGLLGLAFYLLMLGAAMRTVWRAARETSGWQRGVALGALGMLGHLAAHSGFDNLYVHEMYLVVAMLLGMVAWARQRAAPEAPRVGA
ncbi:MAG: O-antigen ligase family protein, partial [Chloroflexi bacterium]|nr:O-antigen ligase family protein [Chloroflexota bacterium]